MLPEKFLKRMKELLGSEYDAFLSALENPPVRGTRLNRIKLKDGSDKENAIRRLGEDGISLSPLSYAEDGYIMESDIRIGRHAAHHAGLIYMQDPGAMSALSAVEFERGEWVLDMCAAPGGKSGQAAAKIGDEGFILSNEYVPKRAKIIVGNFERLGIKNAIVTSLDTSELPKLFSQVFDKVICDAPCSGEGMFRKSDEAIEDWSEENVRLCAERQLMILENAVTPLKNGGTLIYSTCTYSPEENEMVVAKFMERHPEFSLIPVKDELIRVTKGGIDFDGQHPEMKLARRFYPHISNGEGQFVAVLKKSEKEQNKPTILYKDMTISPTKSEIQITEKFLKEAFITPPRGRLIKQGDFIVILTHKCPVPPRSVFMPGVVIGEIQKNILKPHHQLFSAFGSNMRIKVELSASDTRVEKYLDGEEIETDAVGSGFCSVMYEGAPLGGGKLSGTRVKNHYPKGLRNK